MITQSTIQSNFVFGYGPNDIDRFIFGNVINVSDAWVILNFAVTVIPKKEKNFRVISRKKNLIFSANDVNIP